MKIILLSDNHRDTDSIRYIAKKYADLPYRVHCGDSCLMPQQLEGFTVVRGNMDWYEEYPLDRILEIEGHRIYVLHGHTVFPSYRPDLETLAIYAKAMDCDTVFYGHTHLYFDGTVDGIRMLNPGSVYRNRDMSESCFMEVEITKDSIKATRMPFSRLLLIED